jgi:hypothetical protein
MKAPKIRAVEMVRKIRDRHSRILSRKKPVEVIAFYHTAGEAARESTRRSKLRLPKAS